MSFPFPRAGRLLPFTSFAWKEVSWRPCAATASLQSLLYQEVDEGSPGGQEGLLDASPLQQSDPQLTLENKFVDFVLVPGDLLGHGDLATGFVVDLQRKNIEECPQSGRQLSTNPHCLPAELLCWFGEGNGGQEEASW